MRTFRLPDLGEGLQEAEIVSWHVGVGDRVAADQPLVSVETAKAVVEIPSPWSGRVEKLYGGPGDVLEIGAPLVDVETEGEASDAGTVVGVLPRAAAPGSAPGQVKVSHARVHGKASPAVRKRAVELGVDVATVAGTGPGGLVTLNDVETAARPRTRPDGYVPLRGVRRAMAETMARAGAEIVPATVTEEAIVDAWPADADPTMRLMRAVVAGCQAAPALNAWFDGTRKARLVHDMIDLGIAMETDDGLFVPVLRNVAARTEANLRAGLDAMKRDVAARKVPLSELRGQTITLSNFGMLGGLHAALTIVPPQVAILGAGRIHQAARVVGREVRIVRVLPLALTFDHRAVTGAEAIQFLTSVIGDLSS